MAGSAAEVKNPLEMSDEDFLNMNGPPEAAEVAPAGASEGNDDGDPDPEGSDAAESGNTAEGDDDGDGDEGADTGKSSDEGIGGEADGDEGEDDPDPDPDADAGAQTEQDKAARKKLTVKDTAKDPKEGDPDPDPEAAKKAADADAAIDYRSLYTKVMAPFKANGKTITVRNPEEAIQLMQMGANYTKKLQDIQPHRKMLMMLENNNLLDEGKLSYLIDLDRKNPEAIKKLLKDSNIDPMDLDLEESASGYKASDHRVSDQEANFRTAVEDLSSSDTGTQTLQVIEKTWDTTSKRALWNSPEIMAVIHAHREGGVYDKIVEEMDRQITLGQLQPNTPFVERYKIVGDALAQSGAFGQTSDEGKPGAVQTQEALKLAERVAAPKSQVTNGDKAGAASTTRGSSRKAAPLVNPLALSDEEFLEQLKGRI